MEKMLHVNEKRANKNPKNKKKQPLKIVYITNPIKFKASTSEFRALVQELTGQDADTPSFAVDDGGGEAVKVAAEGNVHAVIDEEVTKIENLSNGEVEQQGSDPAIGFGSSYDDDFVSPEMIENFQGLVGTNLVDILKNLGAM